MASAVASKGAALPSLPKKLLAEPSAPGAPAAFYAPRPAAVTAARRPNSTQGEEPRWYDDNGDDSSGSEDENADAGDRRRARDFVVPSFPSQDVLDPVGIPACLTRLFALMEDGAAPAQPLLRGRGAAARVVGGEGRRRRGVPEGADAGAAEGAREGVGGVEHPGDQGRGREGAPERRLRLRDAELQPPHRDARWRVQDGQDQGRDEGWRAQGDRAQGEGGGAQGRVPAFQVKIE